MSVYKFDVIIIGAGPAGVSAAGVLAGTGISVALLEAGVYAGAENWSGCVYFAENLAEQDCFGTEAVEAAPFERRVHRRGTLLHNGLDVVGAEFTDPSQFQNCYTVLRPVYDPYFAHLARSRGVVHITDTTVTSLIRRNGRVIGIASDRGPLYADVVFIAEGDASHLVQAERLERVARPHFLQGVKAVLSLDAREIEQRCELGPGEGAAYELLIRNASISGRTAKLNVGAFLYTNRDSLSLGYVVPLDNVRDNFHGAHDALFEWMRGLPFIRQRAGNATLSSYGAKIIRSGGWRERPILVQDGLAVGGASAGLGVDIPFPNFTGPASATGLYFGRAVKSILKQGKPFDAKILLREYAEPVRSSVYGRNAAYLAAWPGYFGKSKVLFSRTVDAVCGSAHFLSDKGLVETGRFLRGHILSLRGLRELITDTARAISALRLWKPLILTTLAPSTIGALLLNCIKKSALPDPRLHIVLHVDNRDIDAATLRWPLGPMLVRISPALARALAQVYANDGRFAQDKLHEAIASLLRGMRLTDMVVLPAFGAVLLCIAIGTALWDAFRFYVLKTPAAVLLAEPVMSYTESLRPARDLDAVKPSVSLDAKLASNTYRVGAASHIRTLWPESIAAQVEMSSAGLWWVCPARVYRYDAPLFGRGSVTVNYENCIKCESCWQSEPARTLWGRHTDHRLIYRPASSSIPILLEALRTVPSSVAQTPVRGAVLDTKLWYVSADIERACRDTLTASSAFRNAVAKLPASADLGRRAWPLSLAKRLVDRLAKLETALVNDARYTLGSQLYEEKKYIETCITEGRLFHAIYACRMIEQRLGAWLDSGAVNKTEPVVARERLLP